MAQIPFEWGSPKPPRRTRCSYNAGNQSARGSRRTAEWKARKSEQMRGTKHMLGHKHSAATKAKMSAAHMGNSHNKGQKRPKLSAAKKGKPVSERQLAAIRKWAKANPEHYRAMGVKSMVALKKRIAFTDRCGRTFHFRSGYEVTFAEHLDQRRLTWDYEPRVVTLSDGRAYIPDFFIQEWDSFVEVKGWSGWRLDKVRQAQADGLAIAVIGKPEIIAIRAARG